MSPRAGRMVAAVLLYLLVGACSPATIEAEQFELAPARSAVWMVDGHFRWSGSSGIHEMLATNVEGFCEKWAVARSDRAAAWAEWEVRFTTLDPPAESVEDPRVCTLFSDYHDAIEPSMQEIYPEGAYHMLLHPNRRVGSEIEGVQVALQENSDISPPNVDAVWELNEFFEGQVPPDFAQMPSRYFHGSLFMQEHTWSAEVASAPYCGNEASDAGVRLDFSRGAWQMELSASDEIQFSLSQVELVDEDAEPAGSLEGSGTFTFCALVD